ncbi:polynucleotide 3'-phosphatase ZDP isoform X1 [Papaver somniferum]|uniref:polynucleotide 3'-phosphatase ZDP isoform X1 n=1 Tax=Papaver somniferum TaxID=3469 RepID=UPI000E6F86D6|nr:polynucleotide 3'-phosphatase ZDP isoform X1 [Papaver somniferum]
MATPTKIIAEYAKSNRSSCKKCSNSISANSLRLGLYSKDPRGYDVTKWHHLNCFPSDSLQPIIHGSAQSIQGFSSLKIGDQEALEKLTAGCDLESKQVSNHGEKEVEEGNEEKSSKKSKVDKVDEPGQEGEQKKMKVIAEYTKSNRSSCKQCTKPIPSKTLRLGLVSSDRGFDMTKWHHLRCLSTVPLQVDSVDEIDGFTSLKSNHQEALKKLLNGEPLPIEVLKEDEAAIDELQSKSKTSKSSAKIVAEYAKSSRSSCKKCSEAIPAKSLRLGSISKERGHDVTRWYHPACFPTDSQPIISVNEIDGFSSLEIVDQEALQKVMDGCDQLPKEREQVVVEGSDGQGSREFKVRKTDETMLDEGKESSSKTLKVAELEIAFSTSDVQKQYKESTLSPNWKAFQTLIFLERDEDLRDSAKIAAFDFDGCLANTNVKRIGADAWSLMFQSIPEKLNSLYKDGYKLVIFTNESNIERWKNKRQVAIDSKIGRLKNFIDHVKVPIQVFIACGFDNSAKGKDLFRKPNTGMWKLMEQQFNSGIPIDMDQSFYVGDAAGRKNDHSDADIKFAEAIGLKFYLPEDFFAA